MGLTVKDIEMLLADADPDVRRSAIEQLEFEHDPAVLPQLARALQDENQGVRDAAARSLITIDGEETARLVVGYIADTNIIVRNLAGSILMQLGFTSVPAILPYLRDLDHDVRKFAVDLLGIIKQQNTVDAIVPLLNDPDENVAVSAVEALGNIGNPVALPYLLQMYSTNEYGRVVVIEALGKLNDPRALPFVQERFVSAISESGTEPLLLYTLLEALGALGTAETREMLRSHIALSRGGLRRELAKALVQISRRLGISLELDELLKPSLLKLLQGEDAAVSQYVVHLLSADTSADVTRAFILLLGSFESVDNILFPILCSREDTLIQAIPVYAESSLGRKARILKLFALIASDRSQPAVRVLFRVEQEDLLTRTFETIRCAWGEVDEETRQWVIDGLFLYDGERAVEFLSRVLYDADSWLRVHIIELIGRVTHMHVERLLQQLVGDEDEMVRELALTTLRQRGFKSGGPSSSDQGNMPVGPTPIFELNQ